MSDFHETGEEEQEKRKYQDQKKSISIEKRFSYLQKQNIIATIKLLIIASVIIGFIIGVVYLFRYFYG